MNAGDNEGWLGWPYRNPIFRDVPCEQCGGVHGQLDPALDYHRRQEADEQK